MKIFSYQCGISDVRSIAMNQTQQRISTRVTPVLIPARDIAMGTIRGISIAPVRGVIATNLFNIISN
ncbi:hypothetical protein [Prochlorococcus sp. MIT 1341]|uniref:hypothetical protein n=1 Tax=Prochlorococcus sp. MIT 1341 TaxID=3096221 RepID=UPI002A7534C3|nr:hypothetical protein [Prochlorococcus sp. MIT 1341]